MRPKRTISAVTLPAAAEYVRFDNEYIRMTAFKKAEDRDTAILRLFNTTDAAISLHMDVPAFKQAWLTNLAEAREAWVKPLESVFPTTAKPKSQEAPYKPFVVRNTARPTIQVAKPRVFIPMHWHNRREVATGYARRCRTKFTEGLALTLPREKAEITFETRGLDIRVFPSEEREDKLRHKKRSDNVEAVREVLSSYEENDPFAESDLPVEDITE